jgi:hypothetical protein
VLGKKIRFKPTKDDGFVKSRFCEFIKDNFRQYFPGLTLNIRFRGEGEIDKAKPGQMIDVDVTPHTAPVAPILKQK